MLDITVKTMDSQSRSFQVPESMTVGDFKRRISDSVNIPVGSQRLIFQGRVLGDTMRLTSDHHEKTLHLVQRAQPASSTTPASTGASGTANSGATTRPTTTAAAPPPPPGPSPHLMPTLDILNQMFAGQGMFAGAPVIGRVHHGGGAAAAASDGSMNIEINLEDPRIFAQPLSAAPTGGNHQHARRAADSRVVFERMWRVLQQLGNIADSHAGLNAETANSESESSSDASASGSAIGVSLSATTATLEAPSGGAGGEGPAAISSNVRLAAPTTDTAVTAAATATAAAAGGPVPLSGSQSHTNLTSSNTSLHSQTSRSRLRQPLVSELRDFYAQFTQVQQRLQPMFNQYHRFLQDDPAFTSTNSREYQDAARFFQIAPQALRHMADVYDFLANISIPLERVPPRPVVVTSGHHRTRRVGSSSSNRVPGAGGVQATLGQMVRGQQQAAGVPPPSGSSSAPRNSGSATGRRRFCVHQPARSGGVGWSAAAQASGGSSRRPYANRPSSASSNTSSAGAATSGDQAVSQQPVAGGSQQRTLPPYAFQINAHVHPRVTVTIRPTNGEQAAAGATPGGDPAFNNNQQQQQQQQPPQANVSRMNFTWNGSNLLPDVNMPANGVAGLSMDAVQNLVTSATQGLNNQAGVVVVDTANVNNAGEDISRAVTDRIFSTLSTYLNQAFGSQQAPPPQPQQQRATAPPPQQPQQQAAAARPTPQPRSTTNNMATIDETGETQPSSTNEQVEMVVQPTDIDYTLPEGAVDGIGDSLIVLARDVITSTSSAPRHPPTATSSTSSEYLATIYDSTFPTPTDYNQARDMIQAILVELVNVVSFDELVVWHQTGVFPFHRTAQLIRQVLIDQMFQGKAPETNDDIKEGMKRIADQLRAWVSEFFANMSSTGSDCDVIESNFYFLFKFVQTFIKKLFLKRDGGTFESRFDLSNLLNFGLVTFCRLNYFCLDGGRNRLIGLIIDYFRRENPQDIENPEIKPVLTSIMPSLPSSSHMIGMYYRTQPSHIDQLINEADFGDTLQETTQETPQQEAASTSKKGETSAASTSLNVGGNESSSSNGAAAISIPITAAPSVGLVDDIVASESDKQKRQQQQRQMHQQRQQELQQTRQQLQQQQEEDWRVSVPAEWVKTIESDMKIQERLQPQPSFSDAYIVGMPANKRRK